MTNDAYGNLGSEMKAMQDGRKNLMAEIKDNRNRIRTQTGQALAAAERFVVETGKANEKLSAQTRQMLSQAQRELKVRTGQTLAKAGELVSAIRKDVAALKADAGRIMSSAGGFMARTSTDNAVLAGQTRRMLAQAHAESKIQTRQTLADARRVMTQTRSAVAGLKIDTGRVLAEASGVMKRLSDISRQRAASWRNLLHVLHGGPSTHFARPEQPASTRSNAAANTAPTPPRKASAKRAKTGAKKHK